MSNRVVKQLITLDTRPAG